MFDLVGEQLRSVRIVAGRTFDVMRCASWPRGDNALTSEKTSRNERTNVNMGDSPNVPKSICRLYFHPFGGFGFIIVTLILVSGR